MNIEYESAVDEADEEGFCFPRNTTEQLQAAYEALTRNQEEEEEEGGEGDEWEELEVEEIELDWEELDDTNLFW